MSPNRHRRPPLVVGVDAGGTWIRLRARRGGRVVARRTVRVSPVQNVGIFLRTEWRRRGWTRGEVAALVVAARGAWTPAERRSLARSLARRARRVAVMSDVEGAWHGALGGAPGVLVLAGTGSIVLGRDAAGRWAREGGLGPLVGDEGSAFWLAREWLRQTPEAAATARRLGGAPGAVARIAGLALRVLAEARRRQPTAARVVREGQRRLAEQVAMVVRRLSLPRPVTVTWAGGLLADPWFRAGLRRELGRQGISARWRPPAGAPIEGAIEAAARLAATPRSPARRRGPRP